MHCHLSIWSFQWHSVSCLRRHCTSVHVLTYFSWHTIDVAIQTFRTLFNSGTLGNNAEGRWAFIYLHLWWCIQWTQPITQGYCTMFTLWVWSFDIRKWYGKLIVETYALFTAISIANLLILLLASVTLHRTMSPRINLILPYFRIKHAHSIYCTCIHCLSHRLTVFDWFKLV